MFDPFTQAGEWIFIWRETPRWHRVCHLSPSQDLSILDPNKFGRGSPTACQVAALETSNMTWQQATSRLGRTKSDPQVQSGMRSHQFKRTNWHNLIRLPQKEREKGIVGGRTLNTKHVSSLTQRSITALSECAAWE